MTEPLVSMNRIGYRTKFDNIVKIRLGGPLVKVLRRRRRKLSTNIVERFVLSRGTEWPKAGPMTGVKS